MTGFNSKRQMAADKLQEPIYNITVFDNAYPAGIPLEDWVQPAQREWVGLTDAEVRTTIDSIGQYVGCYEEIVARKIETKLKEKNS